MAKTEVNSVDQYVALQHQAPQHTLQRMRYASRVLASLKDERGSYEVKNSTVRFLLSEAVPVKFIERIARFRVKEIATL